MKKMSKMLRKMKKNSNEGFSLVELIIVISIMAILMGVVATQVLPYLNKSKQANDNTILSKMHTAAVSAFSFHADEIKAQDYTMTLNASGETITHPGDGGSEVLAEFLVLMGVASGAAFDYFKTNATSTEAESVTKIIIEYSGTTGQIWVEAQDSSSANKLKRIESK